MTETSASTCACCAGLGPRTPARITNRPGLPVIARRVGTHSAFKASLLAALSRRDVPALAGLGTRADDDFSIGFIDAFATMADVLTFYSERIANEGYLRTALERRSVLELAKLIGYQLDPGVAAETYLAFTIDPPLPGSAAQPVVIDAGARVQSVPGPGESAQTFETVEAVGARESWNELALQTAALQATGYGQRELILAGTGNALSAGDVLLLVGDERLGRPGSEQWDVRLLRTVEIDQSTATTRVTWLEGLGSVMPRINPAAENVRVFVFRQRAAVFGHNAPDPRLLSLSPAAQRALVADPSKGVWRDFGIAAKAVELDQSYPKVIPDSWLVLLSEKVPHRRSSLPGYAELYRAMTVGHESRSAFGLASKVTRIGLDTDEHLDLFGRRDTLVLCQSEELTMAERPVRAPVYGDRIAFATQVRGLSRRQALAVRGAAQHLRVTVSGGGTVLTFADGTDRIMTPGDRISIEAAPEGDDGLGGRAAVDPAVLEDELDQARDVDRPTRFWSLRDRDGRVGSAEAPASAFVLDPAKPDAPGSPGDPQFAEIVFIADMADGVIDDRDRTTIRLQDPCRSVYDRASVRINANVARATHGETIRELVGGGDGSQPNQRLRLRQGPLTFVGADTPSGRTPTLELRVDGTKWDGRDSLFEAAPTARAYALDIADDGATDVVFGDGVEGSRLPTGQTNVRAVYRKGLGAAGNVRAGQLTSLLLRPTGVRSAENPEAAQGGADPEPAGEARRNAPQTVLTLGRAVSRRDYEDFAAGFAGIAKATAAWIPTGLYRGIVVTVAGPEGADIAPNSKVHDRLVSALARYGDRTLAIRVLPYERALFRLDLGVKVDPALEPQDVLDKVRTALIDAFGFEARTFGQGVAIDEIDAVAHAVPGVVAVDARVLHRADQAAVPAVRPRLFAVPTDVGAGGLVGAELLTIDATSLQVGVLA